MNKTTTKLKEIAYGRSGDKGNHANIGVIAYTEDGYHFLKEHLSSEMVKSYFSNSNPSAVIRYELANLWALNFVLQHVLDGGGSVSLRIDAQGKAFAQALLEMQIEIPVNLLPNCLRQHG